MTWNEYFLNIAEAVKLKSKDQRTQIGAVIVGQDKEIVSTGFKMKFMFLMTCQINLQKILILLSKLTNLLLEKMASLKKLSPET